MNILSQGGITEEREILQFHYTMWKDFLAPEQPSWILRFVKRVNEHYVPDRGPLLVHCSAGVGRTGTFVAIDMLLDDLDGPGDQVDIFSCVSYLRHQRMHLVQTTVIKFPVLNYIDHREWSRQEHIFPS